MEFKRTLHPLPSSLSPKKKILSINNWIPSPATTISKKNVQAEKEGGIAATSIDSLFVFHGETHGCWR